MNREILKSARKIVIKIGSSTLTDESGKIDKEFIKGLSDEIKEILDSGKKIIIVSSGARIAGVSTIGRWSRKEDIHYKQALCAIGQVELMDSYRKIFWEKNLHVAQILLTKDDFESKTRTLNIRNTIFTLIDEGVIPIINENDTVSVDEIKIGDNDMLAAYSSVLWGADLLILMSDIDGIYDKSPKEYENAEIIHNIDDIKQIKNMISIGNKSSFGSGGIETKLMAAEYVNKFNIPLIVLKGKEKRVISRAISGEDIGTLIFDETN
ncbi:MAG: glutamate 5-kinase [Tissierellales bacterium]|nr:glutamate 5-kinase [Tissierellales bacterium]